jgi:hypothetical protein
MSRRKEPAPAYLRRLIDEGRPIVMCARLDELQRGERLPPGTAAGARCDRCGAAVIVTPATARQVAQAVADHRQAGATIGETAYVCGVCIDQRTLVAEYARGQFKLLAPSDEQMAEMGWLLRMAGARPGEN